MANSPMMPPPGPPGGKPIAPPTVPSAPGKAGPPGPPMAAKAAPAKAPPGAKPGPGGPNAEEGEEEGMGHEIGFWQQPWVQNVLPFVTSLSVHAGIFVIFIVGIGVYKHLEQEQPKDQIIIPDSQMVDNGPPGGIPNVGPNNDPLQKVMQDKDMSTKTEGWADTKAPNTDVTSKGGGAGDDGGVFSEGLKAGLGRGHGHGGGQGDGTGGGNGDGSGELAAFGPPGGGAIGPRGPVFGNGGNARQIVFVCDASGSMINKMASLKDQLSKAVVGLRVIQSFNIIFFQDNKCDAITKEGLVPATPEYKRKAATFLEGVTTTGTTDPIPGIEQAFKTHPQLVYLLTDGDFPDNDAVLKKINELNKDRKVKINTIAFVNEGDTDTAFLDLLQRIAKENGGSFRHVKESDL